MESECSPEISINVELNVSWRVLGWLTLQFQIWKQYLPPKYPLHLYQTTRGHILKDDTLHSHRREKLKPHINISRLRNL
jgi:hypothetical protein